ncbi:MAG: hypothetical protein N838_12975 [Thiohalocapsa sp. PB-PSB1]|nr:MAG: hypothetical protein N838_12975 [Thiohalocapsa sp. PB-PSB1]
MRLAIGSSGLAETNESSNCACEATTISARSRGSHGLWKYAMVCLLACAVGNAQDVDRAAEEMRPSLEGEIWQLEEYLSPDGYKAALSEQGNLYAVFDEGRFRINSGCNTLNGRYWLSASKLMFSPHVASLLDSCPATLMAQEQALLGLLARIERLLALSDELVLLDATGTRLLKLSRPDAMPLQGPVWQLKAYRNADGTIVPALPSPAFSLEFIDAANLAGRACDTYRAVFTRDAQSLRLVGPLAASLRGCPESQRASQQDRDYLSALEQVRGYRVDQEKLLLVDANGRMLARFEPKGEDHPDVSSSMTGRGN